MTEKRIEAIEGTLSEIMTELTGNPKFGRIGIAGHIKQIQRIQAEQGEEIKKIKAKLFKEKVIVGAASGAIGATGALTGKVLIAKLGALLAFWK